eukprot:tig00020601_g11711.t1
MRRPRRRRRRSSLGLLVALLVALSHLFSAGLAAVNGVYLNSAAGASELLYAAALPGYSVESVPASQRLALVLRGFEGDLFLCVYDLAMSACHTLRKLDAMGPTTGELTPTAFTYSSFTPFWPHDLDRHGRPGDRDFYERDWIAAAASVGEALVGSAGELVDRENAAHGGVLYQDENGDAAPFRHLDRDRCNPDRCYVTLSDYHGIMAGLRRQCATPRACLAFAESAWASFAYSNCSRERTDPVVSFGIPRRSSKYDALAESIRQA